MWVEPVATTKLWAIPIPHIKGNSVLKAYWADMHARENTAVAGSEGSSAAGCQGPKKDKNFDHLVLAYHATSSCKVSPNHHEHIIG